MEIFLITASIAFVLSCTIVFGTGIVLRHLRKWPKNVAWFSRFAAPLSVIVFILIARTQEVMRTELSRHDLTQLSQVVLILAAFWFLFSVVRVGKAYLWSVFDIRGTDNLTNRMRQTQLQFVEKLLILGLVVVSVASVLLSFEGARQFGTSLLASAGVAGLVIGFASQKLVANLLAGFQIAFSQPIRIDDAVVIEGEWGWIEEITLTYVVVRLWDLRRLIVPLSRLLEQPFQNWTRRESKIIGTVFLQVSYAVDVEDLRVELRRLLATTKLWDGDVLSVQVTDLKTSVMEVRILVSACDSPQAFDLRCLVREKMIAYLMAKSPSLVGEVRLAARDLLEGPPPRVMPPDM